MNIYTHKYMHIYIYIYTFSRVLTCLAHQTSLVQPLSWFVESRWHLLRKDITRNTITDSFLFKRNGCVSFSRPWGIHGVLLDRSTRVLVRQPLMYSLFTIMYSGWQRRRVFSRCKDISNLIEPEYAYSCWARMHVPNKRYGVWMRGRSICNMPPPGRTPKRH